MTEPADAELDALYDAIRNAPDDAAPYVVLADLLQARGDPRGELISIQQARLRGDTPALAEAEQRLLERDRAALLGPALAAAIDALGELPATDELALHWKLGHLARVRIQTSAPADAIIAVVAALFDATAGALLDSLDLQVNFTAQDRMEALLDTIASRAPSTIHELRIASANCHVRSLPRAWPRLPRLRALRIGQWGGLELGPVEQLAGLEDLELVGPEPPTLEALLAHAPPRLRRLSLDLFSSVPLALVTPLLAGALPALRDIGLFANGEDLDVEQIALGDVRALALGPVTPRTVATILDGSCRALERLQLAFGSTVTRADVQPIFDGALPALRELYLGAIDGRPLLDELLASRILPQLAVVDLVDLDAAAQERLVAEAQRFAHLDVLRIVTPPRHDLDHAAFAQVRAAVNQLVFVENRVIRAVRDYRAPP